MASITGLEYAYLDIVPRNRTKRRYTIHFYEFGVDKKGKDATVFADLPIEAVMIFSRANIGKIIRIESIKEHEE